MSDAELPLPVALAIAAVLLGGAVFALGGAIGAFRLRTFYQRVHAPTLGSSFGMFLILASSIIYFSVTRQAPVIHEILIAIFLSLTTPISLMLIVRAALSRDRLEGSQEVPHLPPTMTTRLGDHEVPPAAHEKPPKPPQPLG